jgi:hypothetical protein
MAKSDTNQEFNKKSIRKLFKHDTDVVRILIRRCYTKWYKFDVSFESLLSFTIYNRSHWVIHTTVYLHELYKYKSVLSIVETTQAAKHGEAKTSGHWSRRQSLGNNFMQCILKIKIPNSERLLKPCENYKYHPILWL